MSVKPIPDGYHAITPYLTINGAARAIEYYKTVFGATERMRMPGPGGKVMHAELQIGDSLIMLADAFPEMGGECSSAANGESPVSIMHYVNDVDAVYEKAIANGATSLRAVQDAFYGDRIGAFKDPFGHKWHIATHKEDLTPEQIHERMQAAMKAKG